ncbi:MAG: TraR/DksA family transcriptional regulator [Elusimicrobiota bacterium]|jgi:DnaK suppressor protein|nr:TraR/DksA family transcriptional regulator [Elusimicrobiota bacterium]
MNKKDMANLKKILVQKKAELLNKVKNVQMEIGAKGYENSGDEIDTASQSSDKEMFFELAAADKITMSAIDESIAKIEKGIYGKCECCGQDISPKRLMAIPWGRYCIQCQEEAEKPRK